MCSFSHSRAASESRHRNGVPCLLGVSGYIFLPTVTLKFCCFLCTTLGASTESVSPYGQDCLSLLEGTTSGTKWPSNHSDTQCVWFLSPRWILPDSILEQFDETDTSNESYVCFRRLELKAVRKTRASQATFSDKLVRLQSELSVSLELAKFVVEREKLKKESAKQSQNVWEKRLNVAELKRKFPSLGDKGDEELLQDKERAPKIPKMDGYVLFHLYSTISNVIFACTVVCLASNCGRTVIPTLLHYMPRRLSGRESAEQ
jgi:hypothetical protein